MIGFTRAFLTTLEITCLGCIFLFVSQNDAAAWQAQQLQLPGYYSSAPATDSNGKALISAEAAANSELQTFTYTVMSTRDGKTYSGSMVGGDPFGADLSTTNIDTVIIPVVLVTNSVFVKMTNGGALNTKPGVFVFDPTAPDDSCFSSPNDVPLTLLGQSPIFQSSTFEFGPTTVGTTQYIDAFQRGNFWKFVANSGYHTILNARTLPPVVLNVPGNQGLAIPAAAFGGCGPEAVVNMEVFLHQIFPQLLASQGVDSSQFPIFLFYNTVMSATSPNNFKTCCVLGFHSAITQRPGAHLQTFAFIDFEASGLFPPSFHDSVIASHEVGEWMDDPFGNNPTPLWGHVGQVGGCQGNLEVGDPLTPTNVPAVTGANGFTYHLQELAFFSWFYGAPSIAVNSWFSDNNTFKTDAGPVCTKK